MNDGKVSDPFNLARFVEAQASVYEQVISELRCGVKRTHWMWFVFPQLRGLGQSSTAKYYGISSLAEAKAYVVHPILGARLMTCTGLVLATRNRSLGDIFGFPDDMKFRSSMTLFDATASGSTVFRDALNRFSNGEPDTLTLELL